MRRRTRNIFFAAFVSFSVLLAVPITSNDGLAVFAALGGFALGALYVLAGLLYLCADSDDSQDGES